MSMILDALTRAEHERQLEKQPDLKFVTPVKKSQKKSRNSWLWITVALLANVLVLVIFLRPGSNSPENSLHETTEIEASSSINESTTLARESVAVIPDESAIPVTDTEELFNTDEITSDQSIQDRPLAMELETNVSPDVGRPLVYEAEQTNETQDVIDRDTSISTSEEPNMSSTKGAVSFSQTELSIDEDTQTIANAPKLLIDQGENNPATSNVPILKDLPESSRNTLNQYEVNVHVFDDNPERRFVLINMDKYKEGDRIANTGHLVEEITRDGVVVDYGEGRALLPPK